MPVYTVHAPVTHGADLTATDKFAFVRDGFHFWAAVAGVIWLAWHRLWLALIGWIVLLLAVNIGLAWLGVGSRTIFFIDVVLALLLGFEAASLRRWTPSRQSRHRTCPGWLSVRPWEAPERRCTSRKGPAPAAGSPALPNLAAPAVLRQPKRRAAPLAGPVESLPAAGLRRPSPGRVPVRRLVPVRRRAMKMPAA